MRFQLASLVVLCSEYNVVIGKEQECGEMRFFPKERLLWWGPFSREVIAIERFYWNSLEAHSKHPKLGQCPSSSNALKRLADQIFEFLITKIGTSCQIRISAFDTRVSSRWTSIGRERERASQEGTSRETLGDSKLDSLS